MLNKIKKFLMFKSFDKCIKQNSHFICIIEDLQKIVDRYRIENQSLDGRIRILEEQQEIMHNFLVEINKYLFNNSDKKDL